MARLGSHMIQCQFKFQYGWEGYRLQHCLAFLQKWNMVMGKKQRPKNSGRVNIDDALHTIHLEEWNGGVVCGERRFLACRYTIFHSLSVHINIPLLTNALIVEALKEVQLTFNIRFVRIAGFLKFLLESFYHPGHVHFLVAILKILWCTCFDQESVIV